jgi:hypothetical protein
MWREPDDKIVASSREGHDVWVAVVWGALSCVATAAALVAWWWFGGGG